MLLFLHKQLKLNKLYHYKIKQYQKCVYVHTFVF